MRRVSAIAPLLLLALTLPFISHAQELSGYFNEQIHDFLPEYPPGSVEWDPSTGIYYATNELLQYKNASLMADSAKVNPATGEVIAEGHVRIM
ncbi:MAG TPA: hypothetical protein VGY56_15120, partial [Verrucomicrobiae bacterium]|nr:hypothetical protein [Verrucomicrobiae bacterium]